MPLFTYTARDSTGTQTTGTVEAESNSRAVSQLREKGLWVTDLQERRPARRSGPAATPVEDRFFHRLRAPVSHRDLALFYRQIHTLLNSGVPFYQSLEMLSQPNQTPNPHLRRAVTAIAQQVLQGGRLSEAMARYPRIFDRMQVRLVEAGESGGLLVPVFQRLAEYLEREHQIRTEISRKTLYPKLVLFLLVLVLPVNIPLTLAGYLHNLLFLWLEILAVFVPLWFVGRVFLTSRGGRQTWDQVKLAIPLLGKLIRKLAAARFARSLAALYGAGVPIASALSMAGESCGNYLLEQNTARMIPALERGLPLSQVLTATGFFPQMFLGMVSTGESTGNLDTMLDKAAEYYEGEASHATQQLVVTLGVVLLLIVAILVAFKIVSFYMGYFNAATGAAGGGGAGGDAGGE